MAVEAVTRRAYVATPRRGPITRLLEDERWLASFERLLADKGLVTPEELQDRTEAFEFGERDEVY